MRILQDLQFVQRRMVEVSSMKPTSWYVPWHRCVKTACLLLSHVVLQRRLISCTAEDTWILSGGTKDQ